MSEADKIDRLIKWAGRDEWREMFQDVFDDHFADVLDDFGLEFDQLDELVGESWSNALWGCAFEDFVTQQRDSDGLTIVDDYLKRRGWKETATTRRYLEALRDSVMSLYEVSDIVPGVSFLLRDMIGGGEPVRVMEKSASRTLKVWDRIATRIIEVSGKSTISGGTLAFRREAADELADQVGRELKQLQRAARKAARAEGEAAPGEDEFAIATQAYLTQAAPVFSDFWLADILGAATGLDRPDLVNSDGEAIEFHTLRFGLKPGTKKAALRERLNAMPALRAASETFWNWIKTSPPSEDGLPPAFAEPANVEKGAQIRQTRLDDGSVVLGTLELVKDALLVEVNSPERAETVKAILTHAARDLLLPPSTTVHSVDEILDEEPRESADSPTAGVPPEIQARILQETLENHYRNLLDEPIPALGGKTPRALARTAAGKRKVADWLKTAENNMARLMHGEVAAEYDFGWMWRELGISDLRR